MCGGVVTLVGESCCMMESEVGGLFWGIVRAGAMLDAVSPADKEWPGHTSSGP